MSKLKRSIGWMTAIFAVTVWTGCATHTGTGTLGGAALGSGIGALIGHAAGDSGAGAIIGAGAGAVIGGLVGHAQDSYDVGYDQGYRQGAVEYETAVELNRGRRLSRTERRLGRRIEHYEAIPVPRPYYRYQPYYPHYRHPYPFFGGFGFSYYSSHHH